MTSHENYECQSARKRDPHKGVFFPRRNTLRRSPRAGRTARRRGNAWAQAHCPADARSQDRGHRPTLRHGHDNTARQGGPPGAGPSGSELHRRRPETSFGSPILRSSRPLPASCIRPLSWMRLAAGSSAGRWRTICGRNSCWTPRHGGRTAAATGRDPSQRPGEPTQYTALTFGGRCREAGVRPSMGSVGDAYDNRRCKSFSQRLNVNCWQAAGSARRPRPAWRYSASLKAGTTHCGCIPPSATCFQSLMRRRSS